MIYYIRKGQSQVGVTISAVLAQADIVTNIWRAKRARETIGFSGFCPECKGIERKTKCISL